MTERKGSLSSVTSARPKAEERVFRHIYQNELQQMMYVFGEVKEPLPEVTRLMEEIVRKHTIELIANAVTVARKRLSRYVMVDDVVFLIRQDRAKVNRVKDYLGWKDVRKNVKEDGGGGGADDIMGDEEGMQAEVAMKMKKRIRFSWEYVKEFSDLLEDDSEDEDEEDIEAYRESLVRLKTADDMTRNMTAAEYIFYSECRTASFTHRKSKRFREWTGMSSIVDSKPNDDIIDVFGFLAHEMVRKLTEKALLLKRRWDEAEAAALAANQTTSATAASQAEADAEAAAEEAAAAYTTRSKRSRRRKRKKSPSPARTATATSLAPAAAAEEQKDDNAVDHTLADIEEQVYQVPGGLFGLREAPLPAIAAAATDGDATSSAAVDAATASIAPAAVNTDKNKDAIKTTATPAPFRIRATPLRVEDIREALRLLEDGGYIINSFQPGVHSKTRPF
ncbi:Transcription initiation protein spt3 [Sorochytrium milnesiophthora]